MYHKNFLASVLLCAISCNATPTTRSSAAANLMFARASSISSFNLFTNAILLDASAYRPPGSTALTADIRAITYVRGTGLAPSNLVLDSLTALGVDVGNKLQNAVDRLSLFFAIPAKITVGVSFSQTDCGDLTVGPSSANGFLEQQVSLGACSNDNTIKAARVKTGVFDSRKLTGNVYPAGSSDFGIIADIDDTIKNSYVLDLPKAAQALFIDNFTPVSGMPDLFTYLKTNLNNPTTTYVSGNFIQFYPWIQPFIAQYYIPGPISLRNFSFTNISEIVDFGDLDSLQEFKQEEVGKLIGYYPQKKFVNFGDSTQRDPEVYGEIYRQFGDAHTQCIFIRAVDLANNTAARFELAFEGVPTTKWKVFTDPSELMNLDVASGQCN